MDGFNYTFPALRGIQAGREYFTAMCPLRLIPKLFLFDEREIPAELRAQRVLNKGRIPALTRYIVENSTDYVFSALTASVDGEVEFKPFADNGRSRSIGELTVPMSAKFLINDGQHRRAAIEEALKERPDLADETIAVVFFVDAGLKRSQQLFADLNTHAVRASASLGILYDFRDPLANLARVLATEVSTFKGLTEMERATISNRSVKLFTLSGIYHATASLLHKTSDDDISADEQNLARSFWTEVGNVIPEWQHRVRRNISSAELRRDYVHTHSVTLQAIGMAGADLIARYPTSWKEELKRLGTTDWSRSNTQLWEGRAMIGGHMSKARVNVARTAIALKQILCLPLSAEEVQLEQSPYSTATEEELEEVHEI